MPVWNRDEIEYLELLMQSCSDLSQRYKIEHTKLCSFQSRVRIPVIALSSIAGVASFGSGTFPANMTSAVSISVGIVNMSIAIANAVETYYKITENIAGSLKASIELQRLREKIFLELKLPEVERETDGVTMCRNCFAEYESIISTVPHVLRKVRFIKTSVLSSVAPPSTPLESRPSSSVVLTLE